MAIWAATDGALYPESMNHAGLPHAAIDAFQPWIWESQPDHGDTFPPPWLPASDPGSAEMRRGHEGGKVGSSDSEAGGTANWEPAASGRH